MTSDEPISIAFTADHSASEQSARHIISIVRPHWQPSLIRVRTFTDGITNLLLGLSHQNETLLVRIYGEKSELLVDRQAEKRTIRKLARVGLARPLEAQFNNGICYGFVPGETFDERSVRTEDSATLIAQAMAQLHRLELDPPEGGAVLFHRLRRYVSLCPDDSAWPTGLPNLSEMLEEIGLVENAIVKLRSPIVFCHNDLFYKNMVRSERRVFFIDHEYSGNNYQAYDIGNHFCDLAGVGQVDYERYPSKEEQWRWLRCYLHAFNDMTTTEVVSERQVERLFVQVQQCALAAHLYWGVWAVVQAGSSKIDFDYLGYARIRFGEYFARRDEYLALSVSD